MHLADGRPAGAAEKARAVGSDSSTVKAHGSRPNDLDVGDVVLDAGGGVRRRNVEC